MIGNQEKANMYQSTRFNTIPKLFLKTYEQNKLIAY